MKNLNLEKRVRRCKKLKEYSKVLGATEIGGLIGNEVGIHLSSHLSKSVLRRTAGTLSGDYMGGTIGQHLSYWYNNKEKFRYDNGKFKYITFIKDNLKLAFYDLPVTGFTYLCSGNITYQLIKHDIDETWVGFINWFCTMVIWNFLNYHVYDAIKNNKDEKLVMRWYNKIERLISNKFHNNHY
jgi:hypothetical protein